MTSVDDRHPDAPGAPSLALLALEVRAWPELALYFASWPLLLAQKRGDGHSVLVLPPFGATDAYTSPLRVALRGLGYSSHGWKLGQNLGPTSSILEGVPRVLQELADRSERPVSVIGWSAGGILGRGAARRNPDAVRQVITLGDLVQERGVRAVAVVDEQPERRGRAWMTWRTASGLRRAASCPRMPPALHPITDTGRSDRSASSCRRVGTPSRIDDVGPKFWPSFQPWLEYPSPRERDPQGAGVGVGCS